MSSSQVISLARKSNFLIKRQNGECTVTNVTRFLFGMNFNNVPAFKVRVFISDLKF